MSERGKKCYKSRGFAVVCVEANKRIIFKFVLKKKMLLKICYIDGEKNSLRHQCSLRPRK